MSKRDVVVLGAARSAIGTFGGSLADIEPAELAGTVMKALASSPQNVATQWMNFATEWGKIVTGKSDLAPDPRDRRFADPAWKTSNLHKALAQSYMAWGKAVTDMVQATVRSKL